MRIYFNILLIALLSISLSSCSMFGKKKKNKTQPVTKNKPSDTKNIPLFNNNEPFYTVDPKLEDIESEIALLKERVIQYESQINDTLIWVGRKIFFF